MLFCRNVLFLFFFFFLFFMCASVWETKNKGEPSGYLMSVGCRMQLLCQVGGTARNRRWGRWTCVQKMVLNKEAWSCKVLLGKLLTFLQVKCLEELQSQALRKWGHAPKNQRLGTQAGENTGCREERQCWGASVPIFLQPMKDAERRAGIAVPKEQHLPAHHSLSIGIVLLYACL